MFAGSLLCFLSAMSDLKGGTLSLAFKLCEGEVVSVQETRRGAAVVVRRRLQCMHDYIPLDTTGEPQLLLGLCGDPDTGGLLV